MNLDAPPNFEILPKYSDIFSTIIQLQQQLQQNIPQDKNLSVNDVFTVIEKAYWKLYLQENEQNLSEQQIKQIQFHLTSKIGKSLDSQLSRTTLENNKVPRWFLYKGYQKKQDKNQESYRQQVNNRSNFHQNSDFISELGAKFQNSIKEEDYSAVDPYHASIKLQAQKGLSQLQVIHKFFSINQMVERSKNMMDIEKITILHRKGNGFDRDAQDEVEEVKEKFRKKFKLYKQLIRIFEHYGYGARIAKKHSKIKQKITGNLYQYAVVHISKICFKLLEKYVMNFINNKTRYTHRSRLERITYNMFNLPTFFTPQQKSNFIRLLKIVFEVQSELPTITKTQLQSLYKYLLKMMDEKQKNPDKFKNQYMIKLENPTFYNVRKQIRQQVKQEAQERKRLGIKIKGRKSKIAHSLNELKKSLAEEEMFLGGQKNFMKAQSLLTSKKEYNIKKEHKKTKKEYAEDFQEDENFTDSEIQFDDFDDDSQDGIVFEESEEQSSVQIRDYFRKSDSTKKLKESGKLKEKKKKIKKDKHKKSKRDKSTKYEYDD